MPWPEMIQGPANNGSMRVMKSLISITQVCMGIGYTAVVTDDGSIGVAYTYFDAKSGCCLIQDYQDFEGRPARDLLAPIKPALAAE